MISNLPVQSTHRYITSVISNNEILWGGSKSSYSPGYVLGTQASAIYIVHVNRMWCVVQRTECYVTYNEYEIEKS